MKVDNSKRKELIGKTVVVAELGVSGLIVGFDNEEPTHVIIKDRSCHYHCAHIDKVEIVEEI